MLYLTVAAEWNAILTEDIKIFLSTSEIPKFACETSPTIAFILSKYSGVFSLILSKTCETINKKCTVQWRVFVNTYRILQ